MNNGFYKRRWLPVYAIPANQKAAFSGSFAIDRNTLTTKMATDAMAATAAGSSTSAELKCFIHSESASDDDLNEFNATTWAKALTSAAIWKHSDGKKAKIATDFCKFWH